MAKTRILIVEDEAVTALDLEETLASLGYEVLGPASSAEKAVAIALKEQPAIVLMDIRLQGDVDGIAAAEEIWRKSAIPSIFLTSHTDEATLSRAKMTNPYGYVLKPYDESELRVAIEIGLHRREQDPAVRVASTIQAHMSGDNVSEIAGEERNSVTIGGKDLDREAFLRRCVPLNQLDDAVLEQLARVSKFRRLKQGEFIVLEHANDCPAFVVASGRIAVMKSAPEGKELNLGLLPPGDIFGLLLSIDENPPTLTLKAQRESIVFAVPTGALSASLESRPELFKEFTQILLEKIQNLNSLALSLAHQRVEVRICAALKSTMLDFGVFDRESNSYRIDLTRLELAELSGSTPETAIRVTKGMEREGILDLTVPSMINVLKPNALDVE